MTAILAIIKDEQAYLKEWIDYHLSIGFDRIYLYEDYYSTSHKNIVCGYDKVTLTPLKDYGIEYTVSAKKQRLLYIKWLEEHKELGDVDWVLPIDIDEYLCFEDGYDLQKLLSEYTDYPAIWLCWKLYNAGGHKTRKPDNLTHFEYYTQTYDAFILHDKIEWMIKSFVNVAKYEGFKTLHQAIGGVYTDYTNDLTRDTMCYQKAWLNHYFCRSWEDYCWRMQKRGNQHNNFRTYDDWFRANPDFASEERAMLESVRYIKLQSTYILSRKYKLISGGNVGAIERLKQKLKT